MPTVNEVLCEARDLPGDSPQRDAEILLCHTLDKPRAWLYTWPESELEDAALDHYRTLLERRRQGQPVAYLIGRRDFWSLSLAVSPDTLIPRPDTETLVEWALQLPVPTEAEVVDLGTGSGAIALALASERATWKVIATDVSSAALALAEHNRLALGLEQVSCLQSDWFAQLGGQRFDLVVSNPPYIASGDAHVSGGDLRYEPASALVSGADGLDAIRTLVATAPEHLKPGGWLLIEHGYQQGPQVRELLEHAGFNAVTTRRDLQNHERVTGGRCRAE